VYPPRKQLAFSHASTAGLRAGTGDQKVTQLGGLCRRRALRVAARWSGDDQKAARLKALEAKIAPPRHLEYSYGARFDSFCSAKPW